MTRSARSSIFDFVAPLDVDTSEACDGTRLLDICPEDEDCVEGVCGPLPECPLERFADLHRSRDGVGRWRISGTNHAADALAVGTCGGGVATSLVRFVAPADGDYDFELTTGFDAVLFIRDGCTSPAVRYERRCEAGDDQAFTGALEAGQTLYFFIDVAPARIDDPAGKGIRGGWTVRVRTGN